MTDPAPQTLAWPPATAQSPDGSLRLATLDQDDPRALRRGLGLVCELRAGQLPWDEELGIPDPLGSTNAGETADLIAAALRDVANLTANELSVDIVGMPMNRELVLEVNV